MRVDGRNVWAPPGGKAGEDPSAFEIDKQRRWPQLAEEAGNAHGCEHEQGGDEEQGQCVRVAGMGLASTDTHAAQFPKIQCGDTCDSNRGE